MVVRAFLFSLLALLLALLLVLTASQSDVNQSADALSLDGNGYIIKGDSYSTHDYDGSDFGAALLTADDQGQANQSVDAMVKHTFTLRNALALPVVLPAENGWQSDGPHAADFSLLSPLPNILAPGAALPIEVGFRPSALGLRTTMLRIPYRFAGDEAWRSLDFRVQGQGVGIGSLALRNAEGDGDIVSGATIASEDLAVEGQLVFDPQGRAKIDLLNRAQNSLLPIDQVILHGPDAADFQLRHGQLSALRSFERLPVEIQFAPRDDRPGRRQAVLTVISADRIHPLYEVLLTATVLPISDG